ncbi:MAG: hypothetical protein HY457_03025 [Parcubacteria group bacterium]|nr:hypothetical protein [Parcubacteria group bacterium]
MEPIIGHPTNGFAASVKRHTFARVVAPALLKANRRIDQLLAVPFVLLADLGYRYDAEYPLGGMPVMYMANYGKSEMEIAALNIVFLSSWGKDAPATSCTTCASGTCQKPQYHWHAVPWPRLVAYYLGGSSRQKRLKQSFGYDGSLSKYLAYAEALRLVTHIRAEEEQTAEHVYAGRRGDLHLFEASRVNGIPQSLALGVGMLVEQGYVKVLPNFRDADGTLIDYVIPAEKMLQKIRSDLAERTKVAA